MIFVSGFPGSDGSKTSNSTRKLTVGRLYGREEALYYARNADSLKNGYELVYSNLSQPGMSGGAVLDRLGRVVGINTATEGEVTVNDAGQTIDIYLGYSLGVPIQLFLGQITKVNLTAQLLQVETSAPPTLSKAEIDAILNNFSSQSVPLHEASD
ncbi:MAG: trypsin-like peptidase domain-containing protein [Hydrococcus sp. RM1_1_31]|nr:trypsin-like peptidase domain-containing protein [Hydrococcus sp. RM1_1_31]